MNHSALLFGNCLLNHVYGCRNELVNYSVNVIEESTQDVKWTFTTEK